MNRRLLICFVCVSAWLRAQPPEEVTYRMIEDLPYRSGPDLTEGMREKCKLDLYLPENRKGFGTVIWIHAGGLKQGRKYVPGALRNRGYAVAGVGYRLHPDVTSPAYIDDAAAAVAWVLEHIDEYGGDPDKVIVAGASAGGYLASLIVLDRSWLKKYGQDADRIKGLISLSGHAITHFTVRKERGIPPARAVVDELAPLYHVRKDAPPILIVTGDREKELFGRYEECAYFVRMLKIAGHPDVTLHELPGVGHGGVEKGAKAFMQAFADRILLEPSEDD
jgi:acetyl esterase/lipase